MSTRPTTPAFLRVEEAAKVLRISRTLAYEQTARYLATDGREGLPVIRLGRSLRVPAAALDRMKNGRSMTAATER